MSSRTETRDQIIALLLEDKLNSEQIAKICGCHSAYVRAVKQRYITAPEREKLRAQKRADSDEYRDMNRLRHQRMMRNPVYRAAQLEAKRKCWMKKRDYYNARARDRYWQRKVDGAPA